MRARALVHRHTGAVVLHLQKRLRARIARLELDQALKHLRLALKVALQRCFTDIKVGRQCGSSDAFAAGLLPHTRQRLQYLHSVFTGL